VLAAVCREPERKKGERKRKEICGQEEVGWVRRYDKVPEIV
jgi:hypothetical protein